MEAEHRDVWLERAKNAQEELDKDEEGAGSALCGRLKSANPNERSAALSEVTTAVRAAVARLLVLTSAAAEEGDEDLQAGAVGTVCLLTEALKSILDLVDQANPPIEDDIPDAFSLALVIPLAGLGTAISRLYPQWLFQNALDSEESGIRALAVEGIAACESVCMHTIQGLIVLSGSETGSDLGDRIQDVLWQKTAGPAVAAASAGGVDVHPDDIEPLRVAVLESWLQ